MADLGWPWLGQLSVLLHVFSPLAGKLRYNHLLAVSESNSKNKPDCTSGFHTSVNVTFANITFASVSHTAEPKVGAESNYKVTCPRAWLQGSGDDEELESVMQSIFQQSKYQQEYLKENRCSENRLVFCHLS